MHVHDDELHASGVGLQGIGIADRAYQHARRVCTRACSRTVHRRQGTCRHHSPRRCATHAAHDACADGSESRTCICRRRASRLREARTGSGGAPSASGARRPSDADRESLGQRDRAGGNGIVRADSWRQRLHRGDRGRAVLARCAHHDDLRGDERHPGTRSRRPQGAARWRRRTRGHAERDAQRSEGARRG